MKELARIFAAGLCVFFVVLAFIAIVGQWSEKVVLRAAPILAPVVFFGAIFVAYKGFGGSESRMSIEEMEAQGLIERADFKARRAFEVAVYEDEGLHYFLEVDDGVMYLNGQYLYDYLAIDDDEEWNQERTFPCTDFAILRHRKERYVAAIETRGEVFEPEFVLPQFPRRAYRDNLVPEDGDIIRDQTYDELKARFAALNSGAR